MSSKATSNGAGPPLAADMRASWSVPRMMENETLAPVRLVKAGPRMSLCASAQVPGRPPTPAITLELEMASNDQAAEALLGDRADVAIVHNLAPHREIRTLATEALPFGCVMAPDHALARQGSVTLQQIARHPMVLQNRTLAIHRYLDANHSWLFELPVPPVSTSSLQLIKALARTGRYVAFTSELDAADEIIGGSLRFLPVRDKGAAAQSVSVAVLAHRTPRVAQVVGDMAVTMVRAQLAQMRAARTEAV